MTDSPRRAGDPLDYREPEPQLSRDRRSARQKQLDAEKAALDATEWARIRGETRREMEPEIAAELRRTHAENLSPTELELLARNPEPQPAPALNPDALAALERWAKAHAEDKENDSDAAST